MSHEPDQYDSDLEARLRTEAERIWEVCPHRLSVGQALGGRRARFSRPRVVLALGIAVVGCGLLGAIAFWPSSVPPRVPDANPLQAGSPAGTDRRGEPQPVVTHDSDGQPYRTPTPVAPMPAAGPVVDTQGQLSFHTSVAPEATPSPTNMPPATYITTSGDGNGLGAPVMPAGLPERSPGRGDSLLVPYTPGEPAPGQPVRTRTIRMENPKLEHKVDQLSRKVEQLEGQLERVTRQMEQLNQRLERQQSVPEEPQK